MPRALRSSRSDAIALKKNASSFRKNLHRSFPALAFWLSIVLHALRLSHVQTRRQEGHTCSSNHRRKCRSNLISLLIAPFHQRTNLVFHLGIKSSLKGKSHLRATDLSSLRENDGRSELILFVDPSLLPFPPDLSYLSYVQICVYLCRRLHRSMKISSSTMKKYLR